MGKTAYDDTWMLYDGIYNLDLVTIMLVWAFFFFFSDSSFLFIINSFINLMLN